MAATRKKKNQDSEDIVEVSPAPEAEASASQSENQQEVVEPQTDAVEVQAQQAAIDDVTKEQPIETPTPEETESPTVETEPPTTVEKESPAPIEAEEVKAVEKPKPPKAAKSKTEKPKTEPKKRKSKKASKAEPEPEPEPKEVIEPVVSQSDTSATQQVNDAVTEAPAAIESDMEEEIDEATEEELAALQRELAEIEAKMEQFQKVSQAEEPKTEQAVIKEEATATAEAPAKDDKEAAELIRAWDAAFDLANTVMAAQQQFEEEAKAREEEAKSREIERQELERIEREQERERIERETRERILLEQEQERLEREFERLEQERLAAEQAAQQAAEQAALEEELERIFASGLISKSNNFVEYLHKTNFYLLPPNSVVYGEGTTGFVDVGGTGRKSRSISQYIYNRAVEKLADGVKIGLPVTDLGSTVLEEYRDIADYIENKKEISFLQLEHITGTKIALCTFFKPADAAKADAFIREVTASLPFLVNIFRRPLIHLKQAEIIQPVDAVKRVNHLTVRHLSQHPEHWKDIDKNQNIVPARLLTRVYEDDYNIYENVVFRELIDKITSFLQKRAYLLTQILETFTDSVKLDAVNMFNHRNYYLAIGKLYVGFYGMDDNAGIKFSLDSCRYLYKELNNYKNRAVYTKNAKLKASAGEVRRTNILTMHKDYRHVLNLSQTFSKQTVRSRGVGNLTNQIQSQIAYTNFCSMLTVFASSNFNLECITEDAIITRGKLHAEFKLQNWNLTLKSAYNEYLDFDIICATMTNRGNTYKMALIPMTYYSSEDYKKRFEHICKRLYHSGAKYDKYVFLIPFDIDDELYNYSIPLSAWEDTLQYAILPISITELNSFRRIQKLLLEMMVLTNTTLDVCPFCSAKLIKDKTDKEYSCNRCKMVITKITCSHCNKPFKATYVGAKNTAKEDDYKDLPIFLQQEKLYHFRNIVNVNKKRFICPHCGTENSK